MRELDGILDAWRARPEGVLATVVQVKGSAYRRPGARMLIQPDGRRIGSVSGGCLEGDLSRKAWWLTESGRPVIRTYDTTSDEDAVWEFGLGCNGVIDVLLERIDSPESGEIMRFLSQARERHETARIATVIGGPQTGSRLWLERDLRAAGSLRGSEIADEVEDFLRETNQNHVVSLASSEIFFEVVEPAQLLVIFGGGHDTIPLAAIAKELGWRVSVIDERATQTELEIPAEAAVVLMTHNYVRDGNVLPRLLQHPLRYLGILGPRVRTERLFEDLGISVPPFVHAPAGLDIGAGTPETIALSIVAEISATLAGRSGAMLRDRQGPIYDHPVARFRPQAALCELP